MLPHLPAGRDKVPGMLARVWLVALAAVLAACAGKSQDEPAVSGAGGAGETSLSVCDPLADSTSVVKLAPAEVLAAGRAQDGAVYVVYSGDRLFVGDEQRLTERVVTGSGESGTQTDLSYTDDDGTSVTVEVVRDAAGNQMTVARGTQSGKGVDPGSGESLTPLAVAVVAGLSVSSTQTFQIDFAGSLPDERELVVVAPSRFASYAEFRVFFGLPAALEQLPVKNFGSSRSGQRLASVVIDGMPADLTYLAGGPSPINPNGGPSTLTIAGTEYALSEGPVPDGASYLCLSR